MESLKALVRFLKAGPFRGNHRKVRFDEHSLAAVGRMEAKEDRADILASARADREADIRYWAEREAS